MEIIAVIMHLVNGSVVEASVSAAGSRMLCTEVVKRHVVLDVDKSKMLYKGEPVLMYYCKTKKGNIAS
jgi:hypothetical protein|tara:strand:+ start:301 stop:504 length:204 start_codon:yes stop_codon:yes gene_type:complete